MTKDEALDLALEALLWANTEINDWRDDAHGYKPEDQPQIMEAIAAIKQARALDKKADHARELGLDYEPVQEPVARIAITHYAGAVDSWAFAKRPSKAPAGVYDVYLGPPAAQQDIQRLSALVRAQQITIDKLEAQRKWTGLTDRERDQFFKYVTMPDLVKAIEAKLKEKNT